METVRPTTGSVMEAVMTAHTCTQETISIWTVLNTTMLMATAQPLPVEDLPVADPVQTVLRVKSRIVMVCVSLLHFWVTASVTTIQTLEQPVHSEHIL